MKKEGPNYKMACPYPDHTEKTPSFFVNTEKGIAHCFGCGQGGPPVKFAMTYTNQSFKDTIKELAALFNIPVPDTEEGKKTNKLFAAQNFSLEYFQRDIMNSTTALNYLQKRGYDKEHIKKFKIGYLANFKPYLDSLLSEGFSLNDLSKIGLINTRQEGSDNPYDYYSFFNERIIFPIFDKFNRLVGFGGRILDETKSTSKYINTRDTAFFRKGRGLFGLNLARENIRKNRIAYVTEGYFHVLTSHKAGINNTIAPLGTAFTEEQADVVKELADKIVFVLDPDKAGIKAALRAGKITFEKGLGVKYKILPENKDLDDFLRESSHPVDEFNELPEKDMIDFYLETNSNLKDSSFVSDPDNLLKVVDEATALISNENNYARKFFWLGKISESLENITEKSVSLSAVEASYYNSLHSKQDKNKDFLSKTDSELILTYIVNLLSVKPYEAKRFVVDIPPELFSFDKKLHSLYKTIINEYINKNSNSINGDSMFEQQNLFGAPIPVINKQPGLFGEDLQKNVSNYISRVLKEKYDEEIHPYIIFKKFYESDITTLPKVAGILKYRSLIIRRSVLINDLMCAYTKKDEPLIRDITTEINRLGI